MPNSESAPAETSAAEVSAAPSATWFVRAWRTLGFTGTLGLVVTAVFVFVAIAAPWLAPYEAAERIGKPLQEPGGAFLLGTDDVGKDLYSLLLLGSTTSLVVGLLTAVCSQALGIFAGALSGLYRGLFEMIVMRIADLVLALPFIPLLIVAATFAGKGIAVQVLLMAALTWAGPARLIRSAVIEARSRGNVDAAHMMGASQLRLLWRHMSIGAAPILIPLFLRAAMGAVLLEAALAFLGLGDPLRASWGTTLFWANARGAFLTDAWLWWVLPPGLAIMIFTLGLGLLGTAIENRVLADRVTL